MAMFDTVYTPGQLRAVSYCGGVAVSEDVLQTASSVAKLRIAADKKELLADGQSLVHLQIDVTDESGNLVWQVLPASMEVCGAGKLAAFAGGDPQATYNYTLGRAESHRGRLLGIVRAGTEAGTATVKIRVGQLEETLEIPVK